MPGNLRPSMQRARWECPEHGSDRLPGSGREERSDASLQGRCELPRRTTTYFQGTAAKITRVLAETVEHAWIIRNAFTWANISEAIK